MRRFEIDVQRIGPAHSEKAVQLQKLTWSLIKINFGSAERLYNLCHFLAPIWANFSLLFFSLRIDRTLIAVGQFDALIFHDEWEEEHERHTQDCVRSRFTYLLR